jgi:competence protein ComEC
MARKYPAIFALVAVIAGILLADTRHIPSWIYLFLGLIFLIILIAFYYKRKIPAVGVVALLCLTILSAYGYSFRMQTYPPGHISHFVDDDVRYTIYGTIDDWPTIREHSTDVIISVDSIGLAGEIKKGRGRLLVHIGTETTDLRYGDRIYFNSRLYSIKGGRNPTGFNYRRYLNLKGVFGAAYLPHQFNIQIDPLDPGRFARIIGEMRKYITDTFSRTLDSNSAALASGFLIGDTRNIPTEIYNRFRDSGTLHLLAVSGSNVALVLIVFVFLLRASRMKSWSRTALLLLIIYLFSNLAFNQPSVVRAALMASLVLIGKFLQRRIELNNIIALTALIILLIKPTQLFDVGFQLSFATAWGLILLVPYLSRLFRPIQDKLYYKVFIFPLIVCAIAQLVSLPMSAYYFQRMPMISFVSNLIVVPLVSIIVVGSLILLFAALLLPILGMFVGSLLNPLIHVTLYFINLFGSEHVSVLLHHQVTGIMVILYYIFIIFASFSIYSRRMRRLMVLYLLLVANGLVLFGLLSHKYDYRLTVFSVSRGLISVCRAEHPQVVLSNLPLKDYLISERVIEPYLVNFDIENPDLIALSSEYQTLENIEYLYSKNVASNMYLPQSAQNAIRDIFSADSLTYDTTRINYFDGSLPESRIGRPGIYLSGGTLFYEFDSSMIILQDSNPDPEFSLNLLQKQAKELIIIKPFMSESDILSLAADSNMIPKVLICGLAEKEAAKEAGGKRTVSAGLPEVIQTSQAGAVEIVIKNGRARIRKY